MVMISGRATIIDRYTPGSPSEDQELEFFSQDNLGTCGIYDICPDHLIGKVDGALLSDKRCSSVPSSPKLLGCWSQPKPPFRGHLRRG